MTGLEILLLTIVLLPSSTALAQSANVPINHIIVIYLENHSFDNLYSNFPDANGLNQPGAQVPQVDKSGALYQTLPQPPLDSSKDPPSPDQRFPDDLPNAPFAIDQYVPPAQQTTDLVHRFYQHQLQMDSGRMDRFVAWTDAGALPMGYYDTKQLPLYPYAQSYTLDLPRHHGHSNIEDDRSSEGGYECQGQNRNIHPSSRQRPYNWSNLRAVPSPRSPRTLEFQVPL